MHGRPFNGRNRLLCEDVSTVRLFNGRQSINGLLFAVSAGRFDAGGEKFLQKRDCLF